VGVLRDGERLASALHAGALLGGLDLAVVAAEAAELQACISSEDDQFGPQGMIHDGGEELCLTAWDLVPNQTALTLALIDPLGSSFEWIGRFALRCLTRVPGDAAEAVAPRLHEAVFEREAHAQFRTALFALFTARDPQLRASFTVDAHPMVRRAAARAWGFRAERSDQVKRLGALLADPDRGVRSEAVETVTRVALTDALCSALKGASEPTGWQCVLCGADNAAHAAKCASCPESAPDVSIRHKAKRSGTTAG
jgi:hypothetical protein